MPEAARACIDTLADSVRFVQVIVQQPDTGEATPGHVPVRRLSVGECSIDGELFQLSQGATIRPTSIERPPPIGYQQRRENGSVGLRDELNHAILNAVAIGQGLDEGITLSFLGRSVRRTQLICKIEDL